MAVVLERIESSVAARPVPMPAPVRLDGRGTSESAWRQCQHLGALPPVTLETLVPPGRRAVVVSPHPDDEVLGAGGLMALLARQGRDVLVVPVTDGAASHPGSRRWTPERLAQERPMETVRALALLGLSRIQLHRLGLPDGHLADLEEPMTWALVPHLRPDDVVITTWRHDGHPDHEATGRACAAACAQVGATLLEMPISAWHWARPGDSRLPWARACRLPLSPDLEQRKRLAARAFATQTRPDPSSQTGCALPAAALARVLRPYEVFFR